MTPTLRSARLLLTPYTAADENEFVDLLADPEVARYIGDGPEPAEAQRARFGRLMRDVYPHDRFRVWAVWHGGRYVGHGELKPATVVDGQELVYLVRRSAWRQRFGIELAEILAGYALKDLGLPAVHATVAAGNTASLALLGQIGFERIRDIATDDGTVTVLLTRHRSTG